MKKTDGKKSMTLTMRLLREGRTVESAFRDESEVREIDARDGRLYVGQAPATPPTWLGFIEGFASAGTARLTNQSCGSVLLLKIKDPTKPKTLRTMALTFGTGHHSLNLDAFERNFGLRAVLNSVPRSNLRSMDVAVLDATTFQKRIQSSRNADLQGFGIDVERDLLRLAQGVPTDKEFAKSVAGRDALTMVTRTSAADVVAKCEEALRYYQASDYKKDFDWIDYVAPVKDKALIEVLDDAAFAEISTLVSGKDSDLHLALPDIIGPEDGYDIGYFGAGLKSGTKQAFGEIAIEDYISQLKAGKFSDISNMADLKSSHEVRVVKDGEGDKRQKRKLYDCFIYEHSQGGVLRMSSLVATGFRSRKIFMRLSRRTSASLFQQSHFGRKRNRKAKEISLPSWMSTRTFSTLIRSS